MQYTCTDGVSSTSCGLDVILSTTAVTMTFNCYTLIGINYFNSCLRGPHWGIHLESTWSTSMSAVHRKRRRNQRRRRATGRCRWEKWIYLGEMKLMKPKFPPGNIIKWIRTLVSMANHTNMTIEFEQFCQRFPSSRRLCKLRLWDVIGPSPRRCIIWSVRDLGRAEAGYNPLCYWTGESIRPIPSRYTMLDFQWFVLVLHLWNYIYIYIYTAFAYLWRAWLGCK